MKQFLLLFLIYSAFVLALVFLATPPDPDVAKVRTQFVYEKY